VTLRARQRDELVAEAQRLLAFAAPEADERRVEFGVARALAPTGVREVT
jgi:hypothetical protein